jgi:hypothetical protein
MKLNIRNLATVLALSATSALSVSASTVGYNFGQVSGGTTPAGSPPWLQAVFTDTGLPANTVNLTLSAGNLSGSDFVTCWYFNLNPSLNPTELNLTVSSSTGSFTAPSVQTGANGFKAGPDGKFDLLFGFASTGDDSTRFTSGDSLTFTITGISGLTADDFSWLSTSAGGSGAYSSAAHIESGSPIVSAWVNPTSTLVQNAETAPAVPDGATTIVLLGASLIAIESFRRKMQFRSAR